MTTTVDPVAIVCDVGWVVMTGACVPARTKTRRGMVVRWVPSAKVTSAW